MGKGYSALSCDQPFARVTVGKSLRGCICPKFFLQENLGWTQVSYHCGRAGISLAAGLFGGQLFYVGCVCVHVKEWRSIPSWLLRTMCVCRTMVCLIGCYSLCICEVKDSAWWIVAMCVWVTVVLPRRLFVTICGGQRSVWWTVTVCMWWTVVCLSGGQSLCVCGGQLSVWWTVTGI